MLQKITILLCMLALKLKKKMEIFYKLWYKRLTMKIVVNLKKQMANEGMDLILNIVPSLHLIISKIFDFPKDLLHLTCY